MKKGLGYAEIILYIFPIVAVKQKIIINSNVYF